MAGKHISFKKILSDISLFRVVYAVALFFTCFCHTEIVAHGIKYLLTLWGIYLIITRYLRPKRLGRIMYGTWLTAFVIAYLITCILHIMDNLFLNLVLLCHVAVCFFVLYGIHTEKNRKAKYKEFYLISHFILIATTLAVLVSFVTLLFGEQDFTFTGRSYRMVIYENRFTGIFVNPNLLAFYGVVAIVFAHILSKEDLYTYSMRKRIFSRKILIVFSLINALGIFLSDSNGSLLLLCGYILVNLVYHIFCELQNISLKKIILVCGSSLTVAVMLLGGLVGLRICSNKAVSVALNAGNAVSQGQAIDPLKEKHGKNPPPQSQEDKISVVTFAHENDNLDSGRIKLLQKAVVVFANYPIFGVGKENIVLYGSRLMEHGFKYSDLHNGYLTILVGNGLVGFIIFIGFAITFGKHLFKSVLLEKSNLRQSPFICIFAFLCSYCVYALIEKTILLEHSYMIAMFWYFVGYASCYMKKYDHSTETLTIKALFKK